MPRRKRTPEEIARKAKVRELMQELDINDMSDINTLFKKFVVDVLENGLEAELDDEFGYNKYDYRNKDTDNSRNGHSAKTMKTSFGEIDIDVPRDRKGEFEPQLVKKQQTSLSGDIEEKILSIYAMGMTTRDIDAHIREIYGLEVSDSTVSRITKLMLPVVKEWQQRPPLITYIFISLKVIICVLYNSESKYLIILLQLVLQSSIYITPQEYRQ